MLRKQRLTQFFQTAKFVNYIDIIFLDDEDDDDYYLLDVICRFTASLQDTCLKANFRN